MRKVNPESTLFKKKIIYGGDLIISLCFVVFIFEVFLIFLFKFSYMLDQKIISDMKL